MPKDISSTTFGSAVLMGLAKLMLKLSPPMLWPPNRRTMVLLHCWFGSLKITARISPSVLAVLASVTLYVLMPAGAASIRGFMKLVTLAKWLTAGLEGRGFE